jgi:hypothetical protein
MFVCSAFPFCVSRSLENKFDVIKPLKSVVEQNLMLHSKHLNLRSYCVVFGTLPNSLNIVFGIACCSLCQVLFVGL